MQVNRHFIQAQFFTRFLEKAGVQHACLSPGSRNTPLIFAFHESAIRTTVHLDERSSGFYALGMAKFTGRPVAVVTTSGTAAAELYPAIVEARMSRTPLLICTADRPAELRGSGANQTIFQDHMYASHTVHFFDCGAALPDRANFLRLNEAFNQALDACRQGPVHLNFPFEKPFEPDTFTDTIDENEIPEAQRHPVEIVSNPTDSPPLLPKTVRRGLIFCGWGRYSGEDVAAIRNYSERRGFPIIADGASAIRGLDLPTSLHHAALYLQDKEFAKNADPDVILLFGGLPVSAALLAFLEKSHAEILCVHPYDYNDPWRKSRHIPLTPAQALAPDDGEIDTPEGREINSLSALENRTAALLPELLKNFAWNMESALYYTLSRLLPDRCVIIPGNSSIIRDFDAFYARRSAANEQRILVNRGASGIDGMISGALGVASLSDDPVYLISGDLSFIYDASALFRDNIRDLPLCIIILNNRGGGIFRRLPVASHPEVLEDYFLTPQNVNLSGISAVNKIPHFNCKSADDFALRLKAFERSPSLTILEVETDSQQSREDQKTLVRTLIHELKHSES